MRGLMKKPNERRRLFMISRILGYYVTEEVPLLELQWQRNRLITLSYRSLEEEYRVRKLNNLYLPIRFLNNLMYKNALLFFKK